jgi:hypothetical protein
MGLCLSTLVFRRGQIVHAASLVILTQTDKHWGALACPRGAALFPGSMTQGTLLRVSAIRHVGNAAMKAEDGISGDYDGFSVHFSFFFAPFSVSKRTTFPERWSV